MKQFARYLSGLVLGLSLILSALPAHALDSARVNVTVPFDFTVGDKQLKAGDYVIESLQLTCHVTAMGAFGLVLLASSGYTQTVTVAAAQASVSAAADTAIRPFRVNVPEEQLVDLHQRLAATRWPDRETVAEGGLAARGVRKQHLGWRDLQ